MIDRLYKISVIIWNMRAVFEKKEKKRISPVQFSHKALTKKQKVLAVKDCIRSFLYTIPPFHSFIPYVHLFNKKNILNEKRL